MNTINVLNTVVVRWYCTDVPILMKYGLLIAVIGAIGFFISLIKQRIKERRASKEQRVIKAYRALMSKVP